MPIVHPVALVTGTRAIVRAGHTTARQSRVETPRWSQRRESFIVGLYCVVRESKSGFQIFEIFMKGLDKREDVVLKSMYTTANELCL